MLSLQRAGEEMKVKDKIGKNIILCFDGTRENFGPQPITNVLKLYQVLDNNDDQIQMCYYQPGVGTEADFDPVVNVRRRFTLSNFSNITDAMFASSVDHHIVSGYIFLMDNYEAGDQIFMFGFSRGAFIARALAGMLERVGLLNRGLKDMVSMAWRIYESWEYAEQPSQPNYNTTLADEFKRTFSRTYEIRVHFQGLFDSVNSVGIIRDRLFPCTQRSGIVDHVRHAVSLDERKGKFKQQSFAPNPSSSKYYSLNYESNASNISLYHSNSGEINSKSLSDETSKVSLNLWTQHTIAQNLKGGPSHCEAKNHQTIKDANTNKGDILLRVKDLFENKSVNDEGHHTKTCRDISGFEPFTGSTDTECTLTPDLIEKWFLGDHSDVGGGWGSDCATRENLSNLSLRWMIYEAVKHGVLFKPGSIGEYASKYTSIGSLFSTIHDKLSFRHGTKVDPVEEDMIREVNEVQTPVTGSPIFSWLRTVLKEFYARKEKEILSDEEAAREMYSAQCKGITKLQALLWWVLELIPIGLRIENEEGKWRNVYVPNLGRPRYVPVYAELHWSIFWRIRHDKRYRPNNLPEYARKLLEEFEGIVLDKPTLANMGTIASPLKTYPNGMNISSNVSSNEDQRLLCREEMDCTMMNEIADAQYLKTRRSFLKWAETSWREFPDDLETLLCRNPDL